jgi:hypothetical protein
VRINESELELPLEALRPLLGDERVDDEALMYVNSYNGRVVERV